MKLTMKLLVLFFGVLMLANIANAESPREQLKQMVEQLQKSPSDNVLREQVIKLAQELKPAPAVPEEARRYLARGIAAFEIAKNPDDFKLALPEFQNAANAAPWWPDTYFNLAKVQEKIGDLKGAIASYHLYLTADPNAKDAESIRTQSYKLEFMAEQKAKEDKAMDEQKARELEAKHREAQVRQKLQNLVDTLNSRFSGKSYWYSKHCVPPGHDMTENFYCNLDERNGTNWHTWENSDSPDVLSFSINADGKIQFFTGFPEPSWEGTALGDNIEDIQWKGRSLNRKPAV